jgi:hypothetical protein
MKILELKPNLFYAVIENNIKNGSSLIIKLITEKNEKL